MAKGSLMGPKESVFAKAAKYVAAFAAGAGVTLAALHFRAPSPGPATASPGPVKRWGQIEFKQIPLEDAEEVFLDRAERLKKTKWIFENSTPQQVLELFQSCGPGAAEHSLLDTNQWEIRSNQCCCAPSDETILGLSPGAREKIYAVLGRSQTNYNQFYPFRFPVGGLETRLTNGGFSGEKLALIRSLTYTNDGLISFCDLEPLQKTLRANEFEALVKSLYSIPAQRLRLRVTADSNVNALAAYWGTGGRSKRIRPLIESMARAPGGGAINVSMFLPAFARLRLFVFPDPATDPAEARQDCFYTSLNFFNDRPDARFLDANNTRQALQTDYKIDSSPANFGDLIALMNDAGDALHICVYIADDVVFTKNGANYLQPWVLMRMADMLAYFPSERPLRMVKFRRKDL